MTPTAPRAHERAILDRMVPWMGEGRTGWRHEVKVAGSDGDEGDVGRAGTNGHNMEKDGEAATASML